MRDGCRITGPDGAPLAPSVPCCVPAVVTKTFEGIISADGLGTVQQSLISLEGPYNCVDVWAELDADWTADAIFSIVATVAGARVELARVLASSLGLPTGGGSALVASIRGIPADSFEVLAYQGLSTWASNRVYLNAWWDSTPRQIVVPHDRASWAGTSQARNVRIGPSRLFAFSVTNQGAAAWFQLHDRTTTPVDTNVPTYEFPVPAGPGASLRVGLDLFGVDGWRFARGLGWSLSSTPFVFTVAGISQSDLWVSFECGR